MKQGWELKKLGDAMHIARGGSPRPIKKYITDDPNGLNWIKIGDASDSSKYIYKTKEKINKDGLHKTRLVEEGDFLLSNSMSFGRPYIMKTTGCIHDGWLVLKENNTTILDKDFLYHLLCSPYIFKQFDRLAAGSTVRNLNIALVSSVEIPIPPLDEQKRIVAKLDECFEAIDTARANVEKNLNNAKELFQSQLNQIFSQKGDGWVEKKLGEVCEIIGGGTPSKKVNEYYNGYIPWATVRDMNVDLLIETEHKITKLGLDKSASNVIKKGNVVIATRVGLGKICFLENDTAINQDLKGIIPRNEDEIENWYLFWWFKNISKQIVKAGTGATVQGVKIPFVQSLLFPLIPINDQINIVNQLDELKAQTQSLESNYRQELDALDEMKKSILQKAFNGEL